MCVILLPHVSIKMCLLKLTNKDQICYGHLYIRYVCHRKWFTDLVSNVNVFKGSVCRERRA